MEIPRCRCYPTSKHRRCNFFSRDSMTNLSGRTAKTCDAETVREGENALEWALSYMSSMTDAIILHVAHDKATPTIFFCWIDAERGRVLCRLRLSQEKSATVTRRVVRQARETSSVMPAIHLRSLGLTCVFSLVISAVQVVFSVIMQSNFALLNLQQVCKISNTFFGSYRQGTCQDAVGVRLPGAARPTESSAAAPAAGRFQEEAVVGPDLLRRAGCGDELSAHLDQRGNGVVGQSGPGEHGEKPAAKPATGEGIRHCESGGEERGNCGLEQ